MTEKEFAKNAQVNVKWVSFLDLVSQDDAQRNAGGT